MENKRIRLFCLIALLCLLCGCAAKEQPAVISKTCAELADAVAASATFQEMADANAKYLAKHLLVETDDLDDWCLRMDNTRATPEMICILRSSKASTGSRSKKRWKPTGPNSWVCTGIISPIRYSSWKTPGCWKTARILRCLFPRMRTRRPPRWELDGNNSFYAIRIFFLSSAHTMERNNNAEVFSWNRPCI